METPRTATPVAPMASRADFHRAIAEAFERAADVGCREIWLCDVDYADWPLGERAVVQSLTRWACAHRRLTLLASRFDEVPRRHARWVAWRRHWGHVVDCLALPQVEPSQVPCFWFAPGVQAVRLVDPRRYRGFVDTTPAELLRMQDRVRELARWGTPDFPVTTLGL
ncbi:hypothetical protein [Caldimonas sp.]|uniref:hypothetical protein n=1 Tax=Caldimonas sp. TaxID=2838790 RepID=UPI0029D67FEE|nr:hypothetical protein [Caldimonas manganoxidans]